MPKQDQLPSFEDLVPDTEEVQPVQEDRPGALTAAALGAGRGALFDYLDEIGGGLRAATEVAPDIIQKIQEQPGEALSILQQQKEPYMSAYTKYRDLMRQRMQQAEEDYPTTTMIGQLAGGAAIPVPGMGVAKGAPLLAKALKGAATGVGYGALTAAGQAEEMEQIPEMVKSTALPAAGFGAGIPIAGATISALGRGVGKLGETAPAQTLKETYKRVKDRGQTFLGRKGREQATEALAQTTKELEPMFMQLRTEAADAMKQHLQQAKESGKTINIKEILAPIKEKIEPLLESSNDDIRKDAQKFYNTLLTELEGKERTLGFVPVTSRLSPEEQAKQKAMEQYIKLQRQAEQTDIPQDIGTKLTGRAAEVTQKARNKLQTLEPKIDQALTNLGEDLSQFSTLDDKVKYIQQQMNKSPEAMSDALKEAGISSLPKLPTFQKPATVIEPTTKVPVTQMVDEDLGVSLLKHIPENERTVPQRITPDTGPAYWTFTDKRTNKVYTFAEKPETVQKVREIRGRPGREADISPEEAQRTVASLRGFTPIYSPTTSRDVANLALESVNPIQRAVDELSPKFKESRQAYSGVASVLDNLGLTGSPDVTKVFNELGREIGQMAGDTRAGHFTRQTMKMFLDRLRKVNPDLTNKIETKMNDMATQMDLAFMPSEIGTTGTTAGAIFRAPLTAFPVIGGEVAARAVKGLQKLDEQQLAGVGSKLVGLGSDMGRVVGNMLTKAAQSPKTKRAILFGIMQNPGYRQFLEDNANLLPSYEELTPESE